jgi:hypothetical protein
MATIVQSSSINVATNPAVNLANGDYFYELPNVNVTTTGASGISTTGTGYSAYIAGSVFGANAGIFAPSGTSINVDIAATGSVVGGVYGIEILAAASSTSNNLTIDGTLHGGSAGIFSGSSTFYTYVHVGQTGSVTSEGAGITLQTPGSVSVDGSVYATGNGAISDTSTTGTVEITVGATGSVTSASAGFSSTAISFNAGASVSIAGNVTGGYSAISGFNAGNGLATIAVADSGVLTGVSYGMYVTGAHAIYNSGSVTATGSGGTGMFLQGAGYLVNTGTIAGGLYGIATADSTAADNLVTVNTGTISGTSNAYRSTSAASERLVNQGTMNGDVLLGSHAGSTFVNAGILNGSVTLGSGAGEILDSTFGIIGGPVVAGSGGDTIIAGKNGGSVTGGSGNDMLYANQTQTTADNAAHTTLDGGLGVNALYGGGAFTTFLAGDTGGGYNQIWGGASKMTGVGGYTNNTLSFANASAGVFVDLLSGHNAYIGSTPGGNWTGTGTYEDSISNVPNVSGSSFGDVIQADTGIDRITGGGKADQLYAGSGAGSQDTFVYTGYSDSNTVTGYDTIVGFKAGTDKIDLSAFNSNGAHLAISTAGTSNTVYLEQTPGTFNAATDLAMIVNTSAAGGVHASDFIF